MKTLFTELNYKVICETDLSKKQLETFLKKTKDEFQSSFKLNQIIIIVSAHGALMDSQKLQSQPDFTKGNGVS